MGKLLISLLVSAVFIFSLLTTALAKTIWNANSVWPTKNHHSIGLNKFAKTVNAATKGDFDIVVHDGDALGYKGPELLKVVRDGLVPISDMLISEVSPAMKAGVIDSVMTSSPTAVDAKFWEVLKYYEPLNITIATNMVTVNQKAFEKLPKAHQDALVKAGKEMGEEYVGRC